jgi:nucleotide-binding universal stress UspA family protein
VLQPALAKAAEQGITANPVHVLDRYAADGIIETAGERNSDLIVMTSHGRRGVTRAAGQPDRRSAGTQHAAGAGHPLIHTR